MADLYTQSILEIDLLHRCLKSGFEGVSSSALRSFSDVLEQYIMQVGHIARIGAEHAGRANIALPDVEFALGQLSAPLDPLLKFAAEEEQAACPVRFAAFPKRPKKLRTWKRPADPAANPLAPPWFPELPPEATLLRPAAPADPAPAQQQHESAKRPRDEPLDELESAALSRLRQRLADAGEAHKFDQMRLIAPESLSSKGYRSATDVRAKSRPLLNLSALSSPAVFPSSSSPSSPLPPVSALSSSKALDDDAALYSPTEKTDSAADPSESGRFARRPAAATENPFLKAPRLLSKSR